jgi:uncharacterized protein (DUF362 family)
MLDKSKVAVITTDAKSILDDVERAFKLGEAFKALSQQSPVILKDNITWHLPFLSANTTPWQLEGSIKWLKKNRYDMLAVHNDTVVTNPYIGLKNLKLQEVYDAYQIKQYFVNDPKSVAWESSQLKAQTPSLDKIYKDQLSFPALFKNKNIVHLPTVKTHVYTKTTGAVKNSFGGLLNTKRHYCHTYIHGVLADLVAVQKELHSGIFAIADGTLAGNGAGPRTMTPVEKNILIASSDSVAMDAVAARLMGFNPIDIPYLRECAERGLGNIENNKIELVGDDIEGNWNFKLKNNFVSAVGNTLWFSPMRFIQNLFFKTPLVHGFIKGSSYFHDDYWWHRHGRKRMKNVENKSQWGKLFRDYTPNP